MGELVQPSGFGPRSLTDSLKLQEMENTMDIENRIEQLEKRVDALHEALRLVISHLEEPQAKSKFDFSSIPGHIQHSG